MDTDKAEKGSNTIDISDKMLLDNAILESWRVCYIANHYVFPLYKRLEKEFKITRPEWVTLFVLAHEEPLYAQEIINKTGLPKNSISRGVNLLVNKELISKRDDPVDGRKSILNLTNTGWKLYSQTLPYFVGRNERLISHISGEELQQLNQLLLKLCSRIEKNLNRHGKWE